MYRLCDLEAWLAKRSTGLMDHTPPSKQQHMDNPFQLECDLEDDIFYTGHPGFDEITRLLDQEAEMQAYMDGARMRYDEQFV